MSETPIADEVAEELGVTDAVAAAPEDEAEAESGDETAAA